QLRPRPGARHLRLLRRAGHREVLPERRRLYRPGPPPPPLLLRHGWQEFAGSDKRPDKALVAQLDRASDFDSEGRRFESFRARQHTPEPNEASLPAPIAAQPAMRRCQSRPSPPRTFFQPGDALSF